MVEIRERDDLDAGPRRTAREPTVTDHEVRAPDVEQELLPRVAPVGGQERVAVGEHRDTFDPDQAMRGATLGVEDLGLEPAGNVGPERHREVVERPYQWEQRRGATGRARDPTATTRDALDARECDSECTQRAVGVDGDRRSGVADPPHTAGDGVHVDRVEITEGIEPAEQARVVERDPALDIGETARPGGCVALRHGSG